MKKVATALKKARNNILKAEKALQAATRAGNKDKLEAKENAKKQAQKRSIQ